MVPTVRARRSRTGLVWSMAIAGGMPSIRSTKGLSMRSRNCRAYGGKGFRRKRRLSFGIQRIENQR